MQKRRAIQNVPDWAESEFASLCDKYGVVRNKSSQDRTGWDYLIEFEGTSLPNLPHDLQPGGVSARVQVKSCTTKRRQAALKLSNALRFCRQPEPCFAILFVASPVTGKYRIFAREFDEEVISITLKRTREADRDGIEALNRVNILLPFRETDDHTDDLLLWMHEVCRRDPEGYASRKKQLNKTLGYTGERFIGNVRLPVSEVQSMIDHAVGLPGTFKVDHVDVRDKRFDIASGKPFVSGKPDFFSLKVHPQKAHLTFSDGQGRSAQFKGEWRSMNFPGLGDSHFRATFTSKYVQGEMRGRGPLHISFEIPGSERVPLLELRNQLDFRIIRRSTMTVALFVSGVGELVSSPIMLTAEDDDAWINWFDETLPTLSAIARKGDKPLVSIDDLGLNWRGLELLAASVAERNLMAAIGMPVELPADIVPRAMAYFSYLELGDSTFSVIASRPLLSSAFEEEELRLTFGMPFIHERFAKKGKLGRHVPGLKRRFSKIVERLGPGTVTATGGDFMKLGEGDADIEVT
jgi:hypothetical protein